jgi:hypothetical protein
MQLESSARVITTKMPRSVIDVCKKSANIEEEFFVPNFPPKLLRAIKAFSLFLTKEVHL